MSTRPVAIIGAGITGLTAAFYLQKRGIPVVVFEASTRTGGMIDTKAHGGFLVETGPNTVMTNSVAVPTLVKDLNLESRRLLPSPTATTRYIVRGGVPVRVPDSLRSALKTDLLSLRAKLRILAEPFISKGTEADESLAAFVRRRLGAEFLDYLIDPFIAGVYAGDPEQLSLAHALPKMAALENKFGSLIKGAVFGAKERRERNAPIAGEPRMFSFDGGLRVMTDTLASRLDGSIRLRCPVQGIERVNQAWQIQSPAGSETFSSVLFCSPAHCFPRFEAGAELADDLKKFEQVLYPPIARIAFGFRRSQVEHPLDGFGALVPRRERLSILGVLFSSSMFENRAPRSHVLLTVYAGGARNPEILHQTPDDIQQWALTDLRSLLGISYTPAFTDVVKMDRSIPQYNIGYGAVKDLIQRVEARSPGLFISGNFCQGISVSDCISAGSAAAGKVAEHVGLWSRGAGASYALSEVSHA